MEQVSVTVHNSTLNFNCDEASIFALITGDGLLWGWGRCT